MKNHCNENFFKLLTLGLIVGFQVFGSSDDEGVACFGPPYGSPGTARPEIDIEKAAGPLNGCIKTLMDIFSETVPQAKSFMETLVAKLKMHATPLKALDIMDEFLSLDPKVMSPEVQGFYKFFYHGLLQITSKNTDKNKQVLGYFFFLKAMKNLPLVSLESSDLAIIATATKAVLKSEDQHEKVSASFWFLKYFVQNGFYQDLLSKAIHALKECGNDLQKAYAYRRELDLQPFYTQRLSF